MDDWELVERCLSGDQAAIRAFVDRFQGLIFAACLRRLRNREDAEDVAQQTLVRAVRYLQRWDAQRPLRPWILAIAQNRCRTHLANHKNRPRNLNLAIDHASQTMRRGTFDLAEELELALSKIRDEYRDCFILFYRQNLSINRIAEITNCPEGTVKTWLHRARHELAELLTERGIVTKDGYELYRI